MQRREFITLLAGGAGIWPLAARAQQPIPSIGFIGSPSPVDLPLASNRTLIGVRRGLAELGYVEGQGYVVEYLYSEGHYNRLPALVDEMARRQVSLLIAPNTLPWKP